MNLIDIQSFARKLVRPFGIFTDADIENEARSVTKLCTGKHANILTVLKHGRLPNSPYYFFDMPLCETNLEQYILGNFVPKDELNSQEWSSTQMRDRHLKTLKVTAAWRITQQIASGLDFLHNEGAVHRDLKPRNGIISYSDSLRLTIVLFSSQLGNWQLADFGLAAEASSKRAHTTRYARGTDSYRAPELIKDGTFNNKVDIWSLGCILHELLLRGKKAFSGDFDVLQYALSPGAFESPEIRYAIDERTRSVLASMNVAMLEKNWWERPSAKAVLNVLSLISCDEIDVSVWTGSSTGQLQLRADSKTWDVVAWKPHWYTCQ